LATHEDIRVELNADPRMLRAVRGLVRGYIEGWDFPEDKVLEVVLAVDEACTNAMRHAYNNEPGNRLVLWLRSGETCIEIELRDEGEPAPPGRVKRKKIVVPDKETLQPGGLGVQILYEVFDEVQFAPGEERGNRVTMRLNKRDDGTPAAPLERRPDGRPEADPG